MAPRGPHESGSPFAMATSLSTDRPARRIEDRHAAGYCAARRKRHRCLSGLVDGEWSCSVPTRGGQFVFHPPEGAEALGCLAPLNADVFTQLQRVTSEKHAETNTMTPPNS